MPALPSCFCARSEPRYRTKVVDALKASSAFIDEQIGKAQDSDLDREVNFFGSKMTIRDMIVVAGNHEREILGQAIAYARMNHIVPPRTAERETKMKEKKPKDGM